MTEVGLYNYILVNITLPFRHYFVAINIEDGSCYESLICAFKVIQTEDVLYLEERFGARCFDAKFAGDDGK